MSKGVPFTDVSTMTRHIPSHIERAWAVLPTKRGAL
jgi:hypothetical protein